MSNIKGALILLAIIAGGYIALGAAAEVLIHGCRAIHWQGCS